MRVAMVDDGLRDEKGHFDPKPDMVLEAHVLPAKVGILNTRKVVFGSAADSYATTLFDRGGHRRRPLLIIDPMVLASSTVMKLQTTVDRKQIRRKLYLSPW